MKKRLVLICISVLILLGCIGMTVYLLFSNYQNIRLFKQAQSNFQQGDDTSLELAEAQLLRVINNDSDNEAAFVMLGEIARKRKIYPEQVYYCFMAYRLNPLSEENKNKYIESLCFARYFVRLENFLAQEASLSDRDHQLLLYAAGRNGNIHKYKQQLSRRSNDNKVGELAFLLFVHKHLTVEEKLAALNNFKNSTDPFVQQEVCVAETDLSISMQNIDGAEKSLLRACELNQYAFAPALGRFYSRYRTLGKALEIFEKHLSLYHDQSVAMQAAEIYCLLNQTDKIARLRTDYQADSGARAMLCSYYFDALSAFAGKDMAALKDLTAPLRQNINTPLSSFIFFCTDIHNGDLASIQASYNTLLAHPGYLNLQNQADNILSDYLKKAFNANRSSADKLLPAALLLHNRKPELFTAKLILLAQKKNNSVNLVLLKDALKRFPADQGILKIAIEYFLRHEIAEAEKLIAQYKQKFTNRSGDMLRYEMFVNMQKKDLDKISELFRQNFSPELLPEYWQFASATMREKDLLFLSKDKHYEPFCKALLLIKKGDAAQACELMKNSDPRNDHALLFFAAKLLGENGKIQDALRKYAQIPSESPYKIAVLLNMAELHAEAGNPDQALLLANRAYNLAPQMAETQLCYADKLHKTGNLRAIPDIIKIASANALRSRMEPLWIAGMQQRIKECNINNQRETLRELCRQLLVISPNDNVAREYLKKLHQLKQ